MVKKKLIKRVEQELQDSASMIYENLDKIPNEETIAAMNEDLGMAKRYSSLNDLLKDIDEN